MKKIISIFILAAYLCSYTEFNELLKLPLLLEHYSQHNSNNSTLSFSDFLYMHYLEAEDNDGDEAAEKKLPFKSHDNCIHSSSINFFAQTSDIYIKPIETELATAQTQEKEFFYPSFSANIWQPPKL